MFSRNSPYSRPIPTATAPTPPYVQQAGSRGPNCPADRAWVCQALAEIDAEVTRTADTHLLRFPLPTSWGIDLYLKDESTHPTGSLKHRLARSLFIYGLCNGWIREETTIVEASSGSTAVSEAYFARLLGLRFIAVVPASTSERKLELIRAFGGDCELVENPADVPDRAVELARECNGHFMDQFRYAERASDWRDLANIAESTFRQMRQERFAEPSWIVLGAGTGGTSATFGRYVRYNSRSSRIAIADPPGSVLYRTWANDRQVDPAVTAAAELPSTPGTVVEGIGRPRAEESFLTSLVDAMAQVPDTAALAAVQLIADRLNVSAGGSTGTTMALALRLVQHMRENREKGSIVTLLCDSGERYDDTLGDAEWVATRGIDPQPWLNSFESFLAESTETLLPLPVATPTGLLVAASTGDAS